MRDADWQTEDGSIRLYCGDCLAVLPSIETSSVDAVITDPPYSSGGFTRSDRNADPSEKYVQTGTDIVRASFSGDNRDGRSWCYWSALWLSECARVVRDGGYALTFCDWRQLTLSADAMQSGGFVWRGIVAWNKGPAARAPHTGYFRHQCEYVTWGTNGVSIAADHGGPFPGCYDVGVLQSDKHHITGKPTALMTELVKVVPPRGVVLDPFFGSGTTAVACAIEGRKFIGIEKERKYFDIAVDRITKELNRMRLFEPPPKIISRTLPGMEELT